VLLVNVNSAMKFALVVFKITIIITVREAITL